MRELPITREAQPARRPTSSRRGETPRTEPLPRRRHEREQRDALRRRALVSAWLRSLGRAR